MSIAFGLLVMIFFGAFLSASWSCLSAALRLPVASPSHIPLIISMATAFAASGYAGRREGRWWQGLLTGVAAALLYWGGWIFVSSRFRLPDALTLGVFGVGSQILWWITLAAVGATAGFYGAGFSVRPPRIGTVRPSSLPIFVGAWLAGIVICLGVTFADSRMAQNVCIVDDSGNAPATLSSYMHTIRSTDGSDVAGASHVRAISRWDGTQFDLLAYKIDSKLRAGAYDQDQHDSTPNDNKNYSFYALNAARSLRAISKVVGNKGKVGVLAVFNGESFEAGTGNALCASHKSGLVYKSKAYYRMNHPAWALGFGDGKSMDVTLRFERTTSGLAKNQNYAICGVQALVPGGGTAQTTDANVPDDLKTSRTSVAWDGKRFYVLIVHDPDGEADSRRQASTGADQTGGWNVSQLRSFWRKMGVGHAVNLSGGDSTQIAYRRANGAYAFIPSSDFGTTLGYVSNRPVRVSIPTFPPHLMARGSLNYVYLWE